MSKKVERVQRMEEVGVAAVVMYSLFEEQIIHESLELDHFLTRALQLVRRSDQLPAQLGNVFPGS